MLCIEINATRRNCVSAQKIPNMLPNQCEWYSDDEIALECFFKAFTAVLFKVSHGMQILHKA